ncbi:hypothetical protein ACFVWY_15410 [Streptomyces sp. NPDC058195]|uniref:hypothetical protein n=1 Tax=Streptomyces sp. NPDC058195 TaxID=3346375 RepID=UPI0036E132D1
MSHATAHAPHAARSAGPSRAARSAAAALAATGVLAGCALFTVAAPTAAAATGPSAGPAALAAARQSAAGPATLDTLARFFAREGAVSRSAAAPRIVGATVPVRTLNADFVAGKPGAPVARLDYLATTAVSSDGQKASLWSLPKEGTDGSWQVVNIATGDDESRYAAAGARKLPGGTVFREPQVDAWYVHKGTKVLPLDQDAVRAVGAHGTTLAAYRARVRAAYGDKLPGSGYARSGKAGGYAPSTVPVPRAAEHRTAAAGAVSGPAVSAASAAAGAGALLALVLTGRAVLRGRRHRPGPAAR